MYNTHRPLDSTSQFKQGYENSTSLPTNGIFYIFMWALIIIKKDANNTITFKGVTLISSWK